jgi:hypothetical protein
MQPRRGWAGEEKVCCDEMAERESAYAASGNVHQFPLIKYFSVSYLSSASVVIHHHPTPVCG